MKIGIVGLGLIGGSFARAIKKHTKHIVFGSDINTETESKALEDKAIDSQLSDALLSECDILLIALYPAAAVEYLEKKSRLFNKSGIVMDLCGVKRRVCASGYALARENGFTFIGGHPMAGREIFGYEASSAELYNGASMILVPDASQGLELDAGVKEFFLSLGFSHIQLSTPEHHDEVIACTSQLAHIVSSAYVKTPEAPDFYGFSAGSFKDMTRVAFMNERVWTQLFMENADKLKIEIDSLIGELCKYSKALSEGDGECIKKLIVEGTELKQRLNEKEQLRKNGSL